ncbi:MAG: family 20 glycosylhydrolase [Gammaproteobacteria bacterium]|nr:family 20 glycosylhydrolase [Gammaproteobacteria bacterium]
MNGDRLPVLPLPKSARLRRGHLHAEGEPRLVWAGVRTARLDRAAERLLQQFTLLQAGFQIEIDCQAACARYPALGDDESYALDVTSEGVCIRAPCEWGVLRAFATLRLLLKVDKDNVRVRFVSIEDAPRFPWRGLMLDPARRFLPVTTIERTLDGMALAKLNVLHLHLSDDQGFRFHGRTFPELAQASGEYYTTAQLERIVAYAADRGIRVVPEIDMPGHCTSWLASHPEWTTQGEAVEPSSRFGVHKACLDPSRDEVYDALGVLLADVARVFPDEFMHIGGDEVHPAWWHESDEIQRYMHAVGAADLGALHAHFNARVADMVKALGRRLMGWDEIAHAGLPKDAVVQSWRGGASRDRATRQGFDCVFSAGYYLDLFYPADIHYAFDPEASAEELSVLEQPHARRSNASRTFDPVWDGRLRSTKRRA